MRKTIAFSLVLLLLSQLVFALKSGDFEYEIHDKREAIITKFIGNTESIEIPSVIDNYPVKEIGEAAFLGNTSLFFAKISKSVDEIGKSAFSGCTALDTVILSDNLTKINDFLTIAVIYLLF